MYTGQFNISRFSTGCTDLSIDGDEEWERKNIQISKACGLVRFVSVLILQYEFY